MERVYEPTEEEKQELREPRGEVVQGEELLERLEEKQFRRLIAVGDRVSIDLSRWGLSPDVTVVDGRIQRERISDERLSALDCDLEVSVENPPGGVTREAWDAVREAVARTCTTTVRAEGEEDLLALPAITYAARDSVVVYGQRDVGAVILEPGMIGGFVESLVGRRRHERVIVGGSWDRLHAGHRSVLLEAFARGEEVDIGVTSDRYLEEKLGHDDFEQFQERKNVLESFLAAFGLAPRSRLLEIEDFRGNAVEEGDALVVTPETRENGEEINRERGEKGRGPLDLCEVPMVSCEGGKPVSSSRIREGEIELNGITTT